MKGTEKVISNENVFYLIEIYNENEKTILFTECQNKFKRFLSDMKQYSKKKKIFKFYLS